MGVSDLLRLFGLGDRPAVRYTHLRSDEGGGIEMTEPHETIAVQ